jgi:hypothetical protein
MLVWQRRPWLIDHGSALYAHHAWAAVDTARTQRPFPLIRDHVLLLAADDVAAADRRLAPLLTPERLGAVLDDVPGELLMDELARGDFVSASEARDRYLRYLAERLAEPRAFVAETERAQEERRRAPLRRLEIRR